MMRKPQVVVGLGALALAALAWSPTSSQLRATRLAAEGHDPLQDTDGDSLPDHLEWVLLSDPGRADTDQDGQDDFAEAVQYTSVQRTTPVQPVDHDMRIAASIARDPATGTPYVWMHCLFRFASGNLDLDWFLPFLSTGGVPVPLTEMIGRTPLNLTLRQDSRQGLFALVSIRLASEAEFRRNAPCSVNARAAIGNRFLCSSAYVFTTNGALCTFAPPGRDVQNRRLSVQTLEAHDGTSNTAFTGNRYCEQTLLLTGTSIGGPVYEVVTSECEVSEGMRCGTDCPRQCGSTIVAPDGLGAITGG